jgi:hypothetical protein
MTPNHIDSVLTTVRVRARHVSEERLMAAVLEDAIEAYRHPEAPENREGAHETAAWFRSPDRTSPLAFLRVCETLRLDPGAVRAALAQERLDQMLAA